MGYVVATLRQPPCSLHRVARRILLNYAVYNPAIGYSQGMSDLVAPILAEVLDESDTFWCFVGLMQNTIFVSSPRDEDMEKQLVRLGDVWSRAAGREHATPSPCCQGSCVVSRQQKSRVGVASVVWGA